MPCIVLVTVSSSSAGSSNGISSNITINTLLSVNCSCRHFFLRRQLRLRLLLLLLLLLCRLLLLLEAADHGRQRAPPHREVLGRVGGQVVDARRAGGLLAVVGALDGKDVN
jgi:hypothetical protein